MIFFYEKERNHKKNGPESAFTKRKNEIRDSGRAGIAGSCTDRWMEDSFCQRNRQDRGNYDQKDAQAKTMILQGKMAYVILGS